MTVMATRLQERKSQNILATGADAVVTANPGCIIQIVEIRDAAYQRGPEV